MTVRTLLRNGARIVLLGVVATCTDQRSTTDPIATAPLAITPQVLPVITQTRFMAGNSLENVTTYTTTSISPAPNRLVLVGVMGIRTFGASPSPTVTGGGMPTWTEVASVAFDSIPFAQRRMTVYRAMSAAPGSGPITIEFDANQSNAQWIVVEFDGVETSGVNGAGAIVQTGSSVGDLVDGLSVSLAPFANPANVAFGVFGIRSGVHGLPMIEPGAGFTEITEQVSQEATPSDFQAEWATSLNTVSATWADLFGGALAIEINVAQPEPDPVASVTVDPATTTVDVGSTVQLAATTRDANGNLLTGRAVTWESSNPNVATVNATGLVSGVAGGSVTITATSEGQSGAAAVTVTVPAVPVASVSVDPATASVDVAATVQLTATPRDAQGNALTGREVIWTSSDPNVATVSETGLVEGVAGGTVTITAESEEKTGTASVTVRAVPAFSQTLLTFGTNPANGRVYTTASIAPAPNALVTVAVLVYSTQGTPPVPTLSGGGMTAWGVVATTVFDNLTFPLERLTIFRAMSATPGSGPITITSPTVALSHAHWSVSQWTGVEQSGVNGSGAVRQIGAGQADRVSSLSIPLEPFASPTNVTYGAFGVQMRTTDVTPGVGFTEISEQASGENTPGDLQTQWGTNLTNFAASWPPYNPDRNAGGLAIEINTSSTPGSGPAPVGSVTVDPVTANVNVGATVQLTATPRDASGNPLTGRVVTWASSDLSRATVSSTGLVTGVGTGPVTITATSEGHSGTAAVTVSLVPVAVVTVTPPSGSVNVGATLQLTATPRDANGNALTGRVVTWVSSDLSRATVSTAGLVTGVGVGAVTITATSEGQSGTSAVTVTPPPVASVTVDPASASVSVGATVQLTATPRDANGDPLTGRLVTWVSGDLSRATVSSTGLVTGVGAGAVTITATSEGQNGTSAVTVTPAPVASVTVAPSAPSVSVGATLQLTATLRDANGNLLTGRVVTWTSSDLSRATVSSTGLVTGLAVGAVTITATSEGQIGTSAVTVTPPPVASVTVAPSSPSVGVGATVQLTATLRDANGNLLTGRVVTWASGDLSRATVSATGLVTGVGGGPVTITATSEGQNGTSTVTVSLIPVAVVTVSPPTASVNVGATVPLTATPRDANGNLLTGRVVTWTSSDLSRATVGATGVVTGVATGVVTITATSEGQIATAAVTVTPPPVASVTVTPPTASVNVGATVQLTATPKDANGNALTGRVVTWTSGDLTRATVSATGLVTGVAAGAVTITATSEGQSGTSAVTVTPLPVASVTVTPPTASVNVGATVQLTATPKDVNGNALTGRVVTWTSSDLSRATVSSAGLVTGVGVGAVTITATSEGQSGTSAVTVTLVPVASVTVTPNPGSVNVGATLQLTATPKDANGNALTGRVVTWASNDLTRATVSATGLVTGVAAGPVTITATSEGQTGTSAVTVTLVPVATVTVTPNPGSVNVGATLQLTATPKDANGNTLTGRVVTWTSSDLTRATVSATGLVSGVAAGAVTITATSEGQNGTSAVTVGLVPVATVTVTPNPGSVNVGATLQLTATPKDANGNALTGRVVTWTSSDLTRATVSAAGLVTGVAVGAVTITATSEGQTGTSAVTVTPVPVATVTVTPNPGSVNVGATLQLTATPKDANGNTLTGRVVTWASSDQTRATVSATGLVTGVAAGPVTITATSEGQSGSSAVTVTLVPVATVTVTPNPGSVNVAATLQLTATPKDASGNALTGRVVTWTSNDLTRATVSSTGLVTGVGVGAVTITATSEGQSGASALTVLQPMVASVTVAPTTASVNLGSTSQLTATLRDANGNPVTGPVVTWATSDPGRATVTASGLVRGMSQGLATITAMSEGQAGTASVTVSDYVLMVGAGDIAECGISKINDEKTAQLLDAYPGDPVFTGGDNAYEDGKATEFADCYNPTWGRHKARTIPSAGNHDYDDPTGPIPAAGYYGYFGAAAGDPTKGYYSFDIGDWHVVVLNTNIPRSVGSPQEEWLRADLAASTKQCQLAIFHHPHWTNAFGRENDKYNTRAFWDALWSAGVELVVNGHDHHYVRYAPQTAKGGLDPTGIRQITVGTGGRGLYEFSGPPGSNAEVRNNTTFGVLELKLRSNTYDWRFVPVAGQTFTDAGTGACVGQRPPPVNQLPTARPGGPYQSEDVVAFDGRASSDADGDTPLTYAWDFGDGTIGTGAQPSHTYATAGVYTVTLVVTDALGGSSTPATTTVTIANVAPTINAGPDVSVELGQPFNLQAGISDPGLNDGPWTYTINWGDGSAIESGSTATQGAAAISSAHVYAATGQYSAVVTVTDKDGGTGSDAVTVRVLEVASGTIVHTLLTAGSNAANQKIYSTAAFAPGANALITVAVLQYSTLTGGPPVPTLSGGGMTTWDVVRTVTFDGGTRRLTIFRAMSAQAGNGPLTITTTVNHSNMQWIVSQWDGVDVSGLNGAGAVRQDGSASGTMVNGLTVALTPFEHPDNAAYGVFGVAKNIIAVTPGAGFTEIAEVPPGESTPGDLQAQWAKNTPSIGATWTSLTAAALGIEIKVRP